MKITKEQVFNILALANDDFRHYGNKFMIEPITLMNAKYRPLLEILAVNNGAKLEGLILPLAELFNGITINVVQSKIVSFSEIKGFCPWDSIIDHIMERNEKIVETTERGKVGKPKGAKNHNLTKEAVYQVWLRSKNQDAKYFENELMNLCTYDNRGGFDLSGNNGFTYDLDSSGRTYQFSTLRNWIREFKKK